LQSLGKPSAFLRDVAAAVRFDNASFSSTVAVRMKSNRWWWVAIVATVAYMEGAAAESADPIERGRYQEPKPPYEIRRVIE
jgi:hypothetical protein